MRSNSYVAKTFQQQPPKPPSAISSVRPPSANQGTASTIGSSSNFPSKQYPSMKQNNTLSSNNYNPKLSTSASRPNPVSQGSSTSISKIAQKIQQNSNIPSSRNQPPQTSFWGSNQKIGTPSQQYNAPATSSRQLQSSQGIQRPPSAQNNSVKPTAPKQPAKQQPQSTQMFIPFNKAPQPVSSRQQPGSTRPMSGTGARFQPPVVDQRLEACKDCGRTFNEKALAKHEKICRKVFQQKRKVFNSAKQRLVAKEQVILAKKSQAMTQNGRPQQEIRGAMPKWKQDSLAFRIAMKQAKGQQVSMQDMRLVQAAQQSGNNGMKPCKFCGRKFNEEAAQKHIPFCERKYKEAMMKKGGKR